MTPIQQLRSKIPFSQKSAEFVHREQTGHNRLITPSSTPVSDANSPSKRSNARRGFGVNLKEAMARQNLLSHHDEKTAQDSLIPKTVSLLVASLMRYSRVNPTAVASSIVGVNTSGWPGKQFSREWDDAFYTVYPSQKHEVDETAATTNLFSSMLSSGHNQEMKSVSLEEFNEEERRKAEENLEIDLAVEPVLAPPKWAVFDEELLEKMKDEVNKGDWGSFVDMTETTDEGTFDVDAR
jgi:hypothetical protein